MFINPGIVRCGVHTFIYYDRKTLLGFVQTANHCTYLSYGQLHEFRVLYLYENRSLLLSCPGLLIFLLIL